jgi:hypothetical protein
MCTCSEGCFGIKAGGVLDEGDVGECLCYGLWNDFFTFFSLKKVCRDGWTGPCE